jgi:hypothetical protein
MAKFLDFYLSRGAAGGRQLISPASLNRMETTRSTSAAIAGQEAGYGLHNYSSPHEQWIYREHNGGVNGGLTELAYLPEAGLGHVIMINSDDGAAFREISDLVRGFETAQLDRKSINREREVSEANRKIAGYYYPINPRQQVAHFFGRIFGVQKLWFEGDKLARKAIFDDQASYYYPVSDTLYKSVETGSISLTQTSDPIAGDVVHSSMSVLKPASTGLVFLRLAIVALWALFIATSILFFPVWLVRKLRGKIPPGAGIRVRTWPLLASVCALIVTGLFMYGINDPFARLGAPTAISLGIMLSTLAFALFALLGGYTAIKERRAAMNRGVYWHSSGACVLHLVLAAYLASYGVIGLMTWA